MTTETLARRVAALPSFPSAADERDPSVAGLQHGQAPPPLQAGGLDPVCGEDQGVIDAGPLPDLSLLHAHLSWPTHPADTPQRLYPWLVRTLVKMVATGAPRSECAEFARYYERWVECAIDLDEILAAVVKKQHRLRVNLAEREEQVARSRPAVQTTMEAG